MSEYIQVSDYPSLSEEHLEILPNLTVKLQYQDVPTVAPILSYEEKSALLDVLLKCFHPMLQIFKPGSRYLTLKMTKQLQLSDPLVLSSSG